MSERRPVIPQDMKAFNCAIVQEWRANAGRLSGPMAGRNLNLLADPVATVELGAEKFDARARTARPDEREELAKAVPYLESQQQLTEREIPLVILERIES